MGQSAIKNPRRVYSQQGGGGVDPALEARVEYLEQNEYKVTYFTEINGTTGTITKPTGSTILLDQFFGGIDAYVSTIANGQPTGDFPQTAGGVEVDVSSFDASGNFTLTGTPSAYPVALIYKLKIAAVDWQNLVTANILDMEDVNIISQTITNGVTDKAPSEDAVFDALALKQDYCVFTHNPSGVINPADGQYYYFGMPNITATNTVGTATTYVRELASPVTGTIEKAVLTIYCGNYATVNSDLSSWILKNTTNSNTNYTLSSDVNYSNANLIQQIDVTGLSIPITRGDLLMTLIGNATWATVNPTSVYWVAQYLVRKTS